MVKPSWILAESTEPSRLGLRSVSGVTQNPVYRHLKQLWENEQPSRAASEHGRVVLHVVITNRPQAGLPHGAVAFSQPFARETKAIIIWDRIQALGLHPPSPMPAVLAHVMVHEIAHVLGAVDYHSRTGVMKAQWTAGDFRAMLWKPLPFTAFDVDLIHSGLKRLRATMPARFDNTPPL